MRNDHHPAAPAPAGPDPNVCQHSGTNLQVRRLHEDCERLRHEACVLQGEGDRLRCECAALRLALAGARAEARRVTAAAIGHLQSLGELARQLAEEMALRRAAEAAIDDARAGRREAA